MFNLLGITFSRKIVLMQSLRHLKLDFKSFPTMYYKPNSDNRARNNNRLKFAVISNIQSRATELQYGDVKRATLPRSGRAFYATIPQYGRARLNVRNYCKLQTVVISRSIVRIGLIICRWKALEVQFLIPQTLH